MKDSTKLWIEYTRAMLRKQSYEHGGKEIWHLLTAIRGPDGEYSSEIFHLKSETTGVIRSALFGQIDIPGTTTPGRKDIQLSLEEISKVGGRHFARHIADAAEDLGIPIKEKKT